MEGQGRGDLGLVISNASELSLIFFLKTFLLVCIHVWVCARECSYPQRPEEGARAIGGHKSLDHALGIKFESAIRAVHAVKFLSYLSSPIFTLLGHSNPF